MRAQGRGGQLRGKRAREVGRTRVCIEPLECECRYIGHINRGWLGEPVSVEYRVGGVALCARVVKREMSREEPGERRRRRRPRRVQLEREGARPRVVRICLPAILGCRDSRRPMHSSKIPAQ